MPDGAAPAPAAAPAAATATTSEASKPAAPTNGAVGTQKPAETPPKPKRAFKIDGKDVALDDDEIVAHVQKSGAAEKRLREVAEEKKKLDGERKSFAESQTALAAALKKGDYAALVKMGLSEDEIEGLSIQFLSKRQRDILEQQRRESLDPKSRDVEDKLREHDNLKKRVAEYEQRERDSEVKQADQSWNQAVMDVMSEMPEEFRGDWLVADRAAQTIKYALDHADEIKTKGIKVTPKWIADQLTADMDSRYEAWGKRKRPVPAAMPAPPSAAGAKAHPDAAAGGESKHKGGEKKDGEKPRATRGEVMRRIAGPTTS